MKSTLKMSEINQCCFLGNETLGCGCFTSRQAYYEKEEGVLPQVGLGNPAASCIQALVFLKFLPFVDIAENGLSFCWNLVTFY